MAMARLTHKPQVQNQVDMSDVLTISELVTPQSVRYGLDAGSRKRLFQTMAETLVDPAALDKEEAVDEIYDALVERERLGSTALGDGVAIPHCRVNCPRISGAFYTLAEPIEYEAPDEKPVDLVFVLLVPKEEKNAHIAALQRLAQLFSEASHLAGLRDAQCNASLFAELVRIDETLSAANLDRRSA
jgi:PTS system nitrogen regulatory IIA component